MDRPHGPVLRHLLLPLRLSAGGHPVNPARQELRVSSQGLPAPSRQVNVPQGIPARTVQKSFLILLGKYSCISSSVGLPLIFVCLVSVEENKAMQLLNKGNNAVVEQDKAIKL